MQLLSPTKPAHRGDVTKIPHKDRVYLKEEEKRKKALAEL